jgi:hypothetical protein
MQVKKSPKYKAKRTAACGVMFDSAAEARRFTALSAMRQRGEIGPIELHPVFVLAPGVLVPGETRKRPALRYVADFAYTDQHGARVIEDVKGVETPVFRIKRHLLALQGIKVEIVK